MTPPMPDVGPPPPPPSGPVTLQIATDGVPHEGVTVIFQAADSTVVGTTVTDSAGIATMTMQAGGFVTAIDPFGPPAEGAPHELRTFAGVRPFDDLKLGVDDRAPTISVRVTAPPRQTATSYALHTTCGNATLVATAMQNPTAQVTLAGCTNGVDMIVIASDASGPLGALIQRDLAVVDGATIQLTGTYQPLVAARVEYDAVRDGYTSLDHRIVLGSPTPMLETAQSLAIDAGIASTTVALPALLDGTLLFDARPIASPAKPGVHRVLNWGSFNTDYVFFFWDSLLPEYLERPVFSPPRSIFWSEAAFARGVVDDAATLESGSPPNQGIPDLVIATLHVERTTQPFDWTIATPYAGPGVTLPQLPAEAAAFHIAPGDVVTVPQLTTLDVPGTYDAVRARVFAVSRYEQLIDAPFGRISIEELAPP